MRLVGKVALVTGANSQGIGRAIALGMAREGADVAVNYYMGDDAAEEVVEQIREMGRRAVAVRADVSKRTEVEAMVSDVVDALGRIDILVNNAGTISHAPFLEVTDEMFDAVVNTNLRGCFLVGQNVARHMAGREGGSIVNIASVTVSNPPRNLSHYSATKGGIWTLTRAMALELVEYGIRVNSISPGTVLTDINRSRMVDPAFKQMRIEAIPMNRLGMPEDLVGAAVFLASGEAGFITGSDLLVDGGIHIR